MTAELRPTLLPDAVHAALREAIISLEYPPGAVLTEKAISTTYGVARPTAKAALQRLVDQGLLRRDAHRSARVPTLSRADVIDLYGARLVIEEAALRLVAEQATLAVPAGDAHDRLRSLAEKSSFAPFARDDMSFHSALVISSGSARLARMHELIMGEIELCMGQLQYHRLLRANQVADEHQGIIDAIQLGDVELTAALTRAHILRARNKLLARFDLVEASHGPPAAVR